MLLFFNFLFSLIFFLFLITFLIFVFILVLLFVIFILFLLSFVFLMVLFCFLVELSKFFMGINFAILVFRMVFDNIVIFSWGFKYKVLHVITNNFKFQLININSRFSVEFNFSFVMTKFREHQPSIRIMNKNILFINVRNEIG